MAGTILIVEDEADLVFALEYAFRRGGYRTVAASSGQQALAALEADTSIELVLLDLMLPDLPGTEVCQRLRSSERTRLLPVIMMTARAGALDAAACFAAGVDEYVMKPFRMQDVLLRVRGLLRRRVPAVARASSMAAVNPV